MYLPRLVDRELDELLSALAAVALDGPKGVGKTATCARRARTRFNLDEVEAREIVSRNPSVVTSAPMPVLIDEWQQAPGVWDAVRRAVDEGALPGSFLLTGSMTPSHVQPVHSGAGRIASIRMRPMALNERGIADPTVSLGALLDGTRMIEGASDLGIRDYTREIVASGFPGIRELPKRARRVQLDGYLTRLVGRELDDSTYVGRRPESLLAWMNAYAAATSTTASYETIRDAANPADADPPAKTTTIRYRDWLTSLWLLDPVPAWRPAGSSLRKLAAAPKHHLADPALAARLLNVTEEVLITGGGRVVGSSGPLLGALFESLATLTVRACAQVAEARVSHLRTQGGEHEVDLMVERYDGRTIALEVKMAGSIDDRDVRHLLWLKEHLGGRLVDMIVLSSGRYAYRRPDGVAVVPLALLGA